MSSKIEISRKKRATGVFFDVYVPDDLDEIVSSVKINDQDVFELYGRLVLSVEDYEVVGGERVDEKELVLEM